MRLAIFDEWRLGLVTEDEKEIVDVTGAVPGAGDADPLGAGWWVRLCRDLPTLRPALEAAAATGTARPLADVQLRPAALNPGKIVAAASNYAAHLEEMQGVQERVGAAPGQAWLHRFDVFLKAPSSIVGPGDAVVLPEKEVAEGKEVHHEAELALVIGRAGSHITAADALDHVLGYVIALDITVRGDGDRSRRKSYDTFTPLGPWVTTADDVGDPHDLRIRLSIGGDARQDVSSGDMMTKIPEIIEYASSIMRLEPGDVLLTGAPPGVSQIHDGDVLDTSISRLGSMVTPVRSRASA